MLSLSKHARRSSKSPAEPSTISNAITLHVGARLGTRTPRELACSAPNFSNFSQVGTDGRLYFAADGSAFQADAPPRKLRLIGRKPSMPLSQPDHNRQRRIDDDIDARHALAMSSSLAMSFPRVLHADGPDPERKSKLGLYAWLIGQWVMDVTAILEDGSTHAGRGEIHAGWILQRRAIQDVWMIPRLQDRRPGIEELPGAGNWYGTTLRIYDPNLDAWRILWNDPATNFFTQQTGRARGRDIVQEGPDPRGGSMRWTFTEIEPASFHWTAERALNDANWRKEVDIRARRM